VLAPVAGLLVTVFGYGPAFTINAVSYAVSALVLRRLRVAAPPEPVGRRRLWADAREGAKTLVEHRMLRALAAGQLLAALSAGATSALLVVLAEQHLGVGGRGYGLLIGAIGIGAAMGSLQAETPDHVRGRIFASMDVLWQSGRLVSLGVGGVLADVYGIQVVYYLGGALLVAAAAIGFLAPRPRAVGDSS
jgi:MFS family permease